MCFCQGQVSIYFGRNEKLCFFCAQTYWTSPLRWREPFSFEEQSVTVLLFHRLIIGFLHKSFKWLTPLLSLQANPIELHACFSFSFVSLLANLKALLSFLSWKTNFPIQTNVILYSHQDEKLSKKGSALSRRKSLEFQWSIQIED